MQIKLDKNGEESDFNIELYADANIPTERGMIKVMVFHTDLDSVEHMAIVVGDLECAEPVPVRLHSQCFTAEVLGSLKCDCREQLDGSWDHILEHGCGLIIYLQQEGRGIGLGNKIKAYKLQEEGLDTVEANEHLGFSDDLRNYDIASAILKYLDIGKIELITNNPDKMEKLRLDGIEVVGRIPIEIKPNEHSIGYLRTKRDKAGHFLEHIEEFFSDRQGHRPG